MKTFIYSYNANSEGADNLKTALKIKKIKNDNSRFIGSGRKTVINWGSSNLPPEVLKCNIVNKPEAVSLCANKLTFFRHMRAAGLDNLVPEWTDDHNIALDWVTSGKVVVARTVLNGHSGAGIEIMDRNDVDSIGIRAPLYTCYVPKKEEYRVHVVNGEAVDIQRKTMPAETLAQKVAREEEVNWKVRSHANGFIYQRDGVNPPPSVVDKAIRAVASVGLDFGAVDVVYNSRMDDSFCLEINTAPGLEGATIENYATNLRELAGVAA